MTTTITTTTHISTAKLISAGSNEAIVVFVVVATHCKSAENKLLE